MTFDIWFFYRGIRAGSSFSFQDVVVGCDYPNKEPTCDIRDEDNTMGGKKMFYLHLKKYFRGTRFTCQPFLRSLGSKYREGDRVYVSGKVSVCIMSIVLAFCLCVLVFHPLVGKLLS